MTPIYCFTAFSNTGKTTYIEKLISTLKGKGLRVAAVKHDAHRFEIDREGKDSWRFTQAGADMVIVASSEKCAVMENRELSFDEIVSHIHDVDIVIAEGYKHGDRPKIGIYREGSGNGLSLPPDQLMAVVSDVPLEVGLPLFPLDDPEPMAEFLITDMKTRLE